MTDLERDEAVDAVRSSVADRTGEKAFELIIDDWDRLRGLEAKPPVQNFYTAVELADRAKELRERAAKYKGTENADIGEVYERDAAMLEYAARLAAIRYDAKMQAGNLVYDITHCGPLPGCLGDIKARCQKVWDTLAYGDENK